MNLIKLDFNLRTCNVHGEMHTLRKLLSTYLRSNQNVGRKKIISFKKAYQIGTSRIVAIQKRESLPGKKCLLQCAHLVRKLRTKKCFSMGYL